MKKISLYMSLVSIVAIFNGCDINTKDLVNVDGSSVDARFFKSQSIEDSDSALEKEIKNKLLNKKLYRTYDSGAEFTDYFSDLGIHKSANLINSNEQDISFEQFYIDDNHLTIEYKNTVGCDYVNEINGVFTFKCGTAEFNFADTLEKARANHSKTATE